jgi:N-hydroxyarylamine O-acetyltransferase
MDARPVAGVTGFLSRRLLAVVMVDVPSYLARIGYVGPTAPTAETLRAIHHAHMLAVPFENLDIALGRKIVVDEDALVRKIVEQRRGGFCYELNGAFAALLRALGFRVTLLSARVAREAGGEGPEFDHLTLRVDLGFDMEQPWLADVGFGELFLEPLRMEAEKEQADPAGTFRLVQLRERLQLEKAEPGGRWKRQYSFSLQPRQLSDFAGMCHYHQTSPESSFTQNRICTRATPDGRITLSGMKLIVTRNGQREENTLASEEKTQNALQRYFGVRF